MAEHPILFQGEMVRAIYAKLKSQTRRVIKPQPFRTTTYAPGFGDRWSWRGHISEDYKGVPDMFGPWLPLCPYGVPGDALWVRETWAQPYKWDGPIDPEYKRAIYRASPFDSWGNGFEFHWDDIPARAWRPSIYMPRWASRLDLLVTKVRVERVQEIGHDDAIAEGIAWLDHIDEGGHWESPSLVYPDGLQTDDPREAFQHLWDSINAKKGFGWDVNPYVWVVDFEVKHG